MVNLGENLRAYRISQGLSQEELSDLCGVSRQSINHHESGRRTPSPENLAAYAKALNVTVVELATTLHPITYKFQVFTVLEWKNDVDKKV